LFNLFVCFVHRHPLEDLDIAFAFVCLTAYMAPIDAFCSSCYSCKF